MKKMNSVEMLAIDGGKKIYGCPWGDYSSTSYWSVYGHAIKCAYRHGYFNLPLWMIKKGIKLYFK